MKEGLKFTVGVLIVALVVVTFLWLPQVNAWWWGLRKSIRVTLALTAVAVIGGVGVYYKLG
jgi:hypothetical protein